MKKTQKESGKLNDHNYEIGGGTASPAILLYLQKKWIGLWQTNPPGIFLLSFGTVIAAIMAIPVVYVIWRSVFAGRDRWLRLLDERIPQLLWSTLSLTIAVTILALIIGVSLAWLVIRTDLPGRKYWRWLLAMPLVIPPYVGAITYINVFGRSGVMRDLWRDNPWLVRVFGEYSFDIHSFLGVFLVLSLFTYQYVFLIVSASLKKSNLNYEEAAYSLGMNAKEVFWKVNLPLLRPAIGAGAILTSLYVLSDFGAVSILRYVTFTAAIYFQRAGFDTASASVLSLVLIIITLAFLWVESKSRKKNKYYQSSGTFKSAPVLGLGKWKWPSLIYVSVMFFFSFVLPMAVLLYWSKIGLSMGALDSRFWGFAFNSFKISAMAALVCMIFMFPIVYLKLRFPSVITRLIDKICYTGYALPGVIVALGFIFIFNNHIPFLYGTFYLVALAYVVRFLPQAMQAGESALQLVSPRVDEAAKSLGYPTWKVMLTVVLPNILPGVIAGGALVFVSSIKELPVTLMLRPPGFDTLAVRIYFEAHEALYYLAAPSALLIIAVSMLPLRYILNKY